MDLRRPLLVGAGAVLCLLAGLPGALGAERAAVPAQVRSAAVVNDVGGIENADLTDATTVRTTTSYAGEPRSFVLHVPDGLPAPAPLVVALHAHSQKPEAIRAYSRLEALADEQGFVVAFPEGTSGSWNAGRCCFPGSVEGVDDVAFLDEVVALSRAKALVDPTRIFFTGGSNGAMMALRYACERPETVAAVAVVSGPLLAPCAPALPVPVLALHGAGDSIVPLNGGRNATLGVTFPPVQASLEPFRRTGGEVRVQVVPGAGHHWMTQDQHGVDATRAIWSWLRDHPRVG